MNNRDKLVEATMLLLQGKLLEDYNNFESVDPQDVQNVLNSSLKERGVDTDIYRFFVFKDNTNFAEYHASEYSVVLSKKDDDGYADVECSIQLMLSSREDYNFLREKLRELHNDIKKGVYDKYTLIESKSEATNTELSSSAKNKDVYTEQQFDDIWKDLISEIKKNVPNITMKERDWTSMGYKYRIDITTPEIKIKDNVYRYILIDLFYSLPSNPTNDYYIGGNAEIVETSSNETSVAGLKSNGYKIKNEIPNCKISIKAYAGEDIIDKGQSIDEFISIVLKAYNTLETYSIKRFI